MSKKRIRIKWENIVIYVMVLAVVITLIQSQITLNNINRITKEKYAEKNNEVEITDQSIPQLH